jgi:hypothetical protein
MWNGDSLGDSAHSAPRDREYQDRYGQSKHQAVHIVSFPIRTIYSPQPGIAPDKLMTNRAHRMGDEDRIHRTGLARQVSGEHTGSPYDPRLGE